MHIWRGYHGKTEGGASDKVEILVSCNCNNCNKKVQNSDFVSAALHGENGSKSEKWDFLLFFAIFAKGFKQNSIN